MKNYNRNKLSNLNDNSQEKKEHDIVINKINELYRFLIASNEYQINHHYQSLNVEK